MFVTLYAEHYVAVLIFSSMILGISRTRNNFQSSDVKSWFFFMKNNVCPEVTSNERKT